MTTVAKSVAVNAHGGGAGRIAEGNKTSVIYSLIRDQKYTEAVRVLNNELQILPRSRAALSLLGYCYYHMQDFHSASSTYDLFFFHAVQNNNFEIFILIATIFWQL
jgi:tetratricopeptide repeat protein 30